MVEATVIYRYVSSAYWAVQTLCTVGYGDIPAVTLSEKVMAIVWMIGGFALYSYTIGNFQSIINEIDLKSYHLQIKLDTMLEFSKRTGLPSGLQKDITRYISNNSFNEDIIPESMIEILEEMPMSIKGDIAKQAFEEIIANIKFFQEKEDRFLWAFLPKMKQMNFFAGEYLFTQREQAEEVYFIFKGKVKLMYDLTEGETDIPYLIPFNMYVEGSYFGDSDVLADTSNEGRDGTALVDAKSIIYVIVGKDLLQVLKLFKHSYLKEMRIIAKERRLHHKSAIDELKM